MAIRLKKFSNHHALGVHKDSELRSEIKYFEDEIKKSEDEIRTAENALNDPKHESTDERRIYYSYKIEEERATIAYARRMIRACNRLLAGNC